MTRKVQSLRYVEQQHLYTSWVALRYGRESRTDEHLPNDVADVSYQTRTKPNALTIVIKLGMCSSPTSR
jgi:hypothetical protein